MYKYICMYKFCYKIKAILLANTYAFLKLRYVKVHSFS